MWIDYPNQITESPEALLREEKRLKATPMADRVRFLRLLKSATYPTQTQVADLLGYDVRTSARRACWDTMCAHGGVGGVATARRACPVFWRRPKNAGPKSGSRLWHARRCSRR